MYEKMPDSTINKRPRPDRKLRKKKFNQQRDFQADLTAGIDKLLFSFGLNRHEDDSIRVRSSNIRLEIHNSLLVLVLQTLDTRSLEPTKEIPPRFELRLSLFYKDNSNLSSTLANGLQAPKGLMTDMLCLVLSKLVLHEVYKKDALIWLEVDGDDDGVPQEELIQKVYKPLGFENRFNYGRGGEDVGLYATLGEVINACGVREKEWSAERRLAQLAFISNRNRVNPHQ